MIAATTLPGKLRLKSQRDFRSVYGRGQRASGEWITVVLRRQQARQPEGDAADPGPRLGVSVSKDHGGAVRRNKIKRLLREAFRLERHRLPPDVDIVLIPKKREQPLPLADLRQELVKLVAKALRKKSTPRRHRRTGKDSR